MEQKWSKNGSEMEQQLQTKWQIHVRIYICIRYVFKIKLFENLWVQKTFIPMCYKGYPNETYSLAMSAT